MDTIITHNDTSIPVYFAEPAAPRGGIILIHEVWGLNGNIRSIADRLMREGFSVIAPDLISETGITEKIDQSILARVHDPATRDEAQKELRAAMAPIQAPGFGEATVKKLVHLVDHFRDVLKLEKVAVMGFCFGGTYSYALAAEDPRLAAALPFYGYAPKEEEKYSLIACPVRAFLGGKDAALVDDLPRVQSLMEKFGKDFQATIYADAGHAFMNGTNPATYNKEAADAAWAASLEFLNKVFA